MINVQKYFPLHSTFQMDYECTDVSDEAFREIAELCRRETGIQLASIIGTSWLDVNNKYTGTLPKRISSWYYRMHKIKTSPELKQRIGDIARASMVLNNKYTFDFTDKIDWTHGDFGDFESCYMTSGARREYLKWYGVHAMRFYNKDGMGIARCLLLFPDEYVHIKPEIEIDPRNLVVACNAYAAGMGLNLYRMSEILMRHTGLKRHQAKVYNAMDSVFSTNSAVARGNNEDGEDSFDYVFSEDDVSQLRQISLDWDGHKPLRCDYCGSMSRKYVQMDSPKRYSQMTCCQKCQSQHTFECIWCGWKPIEERIMYQYPPSGEMLQICKTCFSFNLETCYICKQKTPAQFTNSFYGKDKVYKVCEWHVVEGCYRCGAFYERGKPHECVVQVYGHVAKNEANITETAVRDMREAYQDMREAYRDWQIDTTSTTGSITFGATTVPRLSLRQLQWVNSEANNDNHDAHDEENDDHDDQTDYDEDNDDFDEDEEERLMEDE